MLGPEAAPVVDEAAAIEAMMGAVKALAAARVEEVKAWGEVPHRSAAEACRIGPVSPKGEAKDISTLAGAWPSRPTWPMPLFLGGCRRPRRP